MRRAKPAAAESLGWPSQNGCASEQTLSTAWNNATDAVSHSGYDSDMSTSMSFGSRARGLDGADQVLLGEHQVALPFLHAQEGLVADGRMDFTRALRLSLADSTTAAPTRRPRLARQAPRHAMTASPRGHVVLGNA